MSNNIISPNSKLERNIEIYIAKKSGETYRTLGIQHDLSLARLQKIMDSINKMMLKHPEVAQLISERISKKLKGN